MIVQSLQTHTSLRVMRTLSSAILVVFAVLKLHVLMTASDPAQESFLQCLSNHSQSSLRISSVTYVSNNSSYTTALQTDLAFDSSRLYLKHFIFILGESFSPLRSSKNLLVTSSLVSKSIFKHSNSFKFF